MCDQHQSVNYMPVVTFTTQCIHPPAGGSAGSRLGMTGPRPSFHDPRSVVVTMVPCRHMPPGSLTAVGPVTLRELCGLHPHALLVQPIGRKDRWQNWPSQNILPGPVVYCQRTEQEHLPRKLMVQNMILAAILC